MAISTVSFGVVALFALVFAISLSSIQALALALAPAPAPVSDGEFFSCCLLIRFSPGFHLARKIKKIKEGFYLPFQL